MARERWKDIPGWARYYQASNLGRIRSLDRVVRHPVYRSMRIKGCILKPAPCNACEHSKINLCLDGSQRSEWVHILVASTWLGPCPIDHEVLHGVKGPLDNSVGNLTYGSHKQNQLDMRRDGTHCARAVRRSDGVEFPSIMIAAEETGLSGGGHIGDVCRGYRDTAGGFGWDFIEDSI